MGHLHAMHDELTALATALTEAVPQQTAAIKDAFSSMSIDLQDFLVRYIAHCRASSMDVIEMASCYAFLVKETMKEQMWFARHRTYRHSTFAEVADKVYHDEDYMKRYMAGLAVSTAIWQNHVAIYEFFKRFIAGMAGGGAYLEVGAGHGLFACEVLRSGKFDDCDIVDISATSLELTRDLLLEFEEQCSVKYIHSDFLQMHGGNKYRLIVIGEVLEHVEEPGRFLLHARELLGDDGLIYVSTCLNAPEPDHIYLFRDLDDVNRLIDDAGLDVVDSVCMPHHGQTLECCLEDLLPVNVAYVLKTKKGEH